MRRSIEFLPRVAFTAISLATGNVAAASHPVPMPPPILAAFNLGAPAAFAPDLSGVGQKLRAQWLARGHSVQHLAPLTPPTITGGAVTASTITIGTAGQYPSLSLSYQTDTPGLSFVSVEFASPNGQTVFSGAYPTDYYTQAGTLNFATVQGLNLYSAPGQWSLVSATIFDNAGNSKTYSASQLKALFTNLSFTIVNTGAVDEKPPTILSGQLVNDTVSLSAPLPTLAAKILAKDNNGPGMYIAYVQISPPGGGYSFYDLVPYPEPVDRGRLKANNLFDQFSPTGTWSIVAYGVCDYAGYCSGSSNESDVISLFGTDTFTVTP